MFSSFLGLMSAWSYTSIGKYTILPLRALVSSVLGLFKAVSCQQLCERICFTADDEHCVCVQNFQLNNFISVHCQLKCFIPILNCFTFERNFPWRNIFWGKRISMKGTLDFPALFNKTNDKLKKKFFELKIRKNVRIENKHKLLCI